MTNRISSRMVATLAALALLLSLSSCGSSDDGNTAVAAPAATEAPATVEPATSAPVASEDAHDDDHDDDDHDDDDHDEDAHDDDHDDDDHDDDDHDDAYHDDTDHDHADEADADHEHDETAALSDYTDSYTLIDETFGTMVSVTVDGATRTIISNSIPDHETGEFPNSGNPNTITEQSLVNEYPTEPVYVGDASFAQMPGIAVNGIAFEPGTAESVTCESGENYRIEGLQDLYNLGMDFNNAHVQPNGQYHYHGIAELLVGNHDAGDDLVHVGFAADGFLMYYSKSGAYSSSYQLSTDARTGTGCMASGPAGGTAVSIEGTVPDGTYVSDWDYIAGAGDLDSCNGAMIDGEYAYVLTDEYPFVPRCLNGEFTPTGPGGGDTPGGAAPGGPPGAPDLSEAAASLGITEQELIAALGTPPDLAGAAATLGVTIEELRAILPPPPGQ